MNFKEFNRENTSPRKKDRCLLRITRKTGTFNLSTDAVKHLNLTDGDGIVILQDEQRPKDFYLAKSDSADAFRLRVKRSKDMIFNSSLLATIILDAVSVTMSASFAISVEPTVVADRDLFGIITVKPLSVK